MPWNIFHRLAMSHKPQHCSPTQTFPTLHPKTLHDSGWKRKAKTRAKIIIVRGCTTSNRIVYKQKQSTFSLFAIEWKIIIACWANYRANKNRFCRSQHQVCTWLSRLPETTSGAEALPRRVSGEGMSDFSLFATPLSAHLPTIEVILILRLNASTFSQPHATRESISSQPTRQLA